MIKKNRTIIVFATIVILLVGGVLFMMMRRQAEPSINSYDDCAAAGYPIQESFPTRCVTPDGKSFTGPTQ